MSYKIEKSEGYFLITFFDTIDRDAVVSSYQELLQDEEFSLETHTIWDMRNGTAEISYVDLKEIADLVIASSEHRSNNAKAAHIVVDPIDKKVFQNYITATAHYPVEFKIFEDIESAKKWLFS